MRRWCPQLGQTPSDWTNLSLGSTWPHDSHLSQTSAGISSRSRWGVRARRSLRNQAIRDVTVEMDGRAGTQGPRGPGNMDAAAQVALGQQRKTLSEFAIRDVTPFPADPGREPDGQEA